VYTHKKIGAKTKVTKESKTHVLTKTGRTRKRVAQAKEVGQGIKLRDKAGVGLGLSLHGGHTWWVGGLKKKNDGKAVVSKKKKTG